MSDKSRGTVDFEFSVYRNIKVSITDQILGYIKMKIIKGDWITGQKLPSQRKLAELLSVNRSTIEWNRYIESGIHKANQPTIQTINMLEFDNTITRLSTGEMAPDLFPHRIPLIEERTHKAC